MRFKQGILIVIGFSILSFGLPKNLQKKVHKEITGTFEIENFDLISVTIPTELEQTLPSRFGADNLFRIESMSFYFIYSQDKNSTENKDYYVFHKRAKQ